ncbi:MAG: hypothetical protein GX638_04070 [Crenarchaeota archaeon]|nr:hypothetical protein [Thermoproteota archaeon]
MNRKKLKDLAEYNFSTTWKKNLWKATTKVFIYNMCLILICLLPVLFSIYFIIVPIAWFVLLAFGLIKLHLIYYYSIFNLISFDEKDLSYLSSEWKESSESAYYKFGVITRLGIMLNDGFAPWDSIERIEFKSKQTHWLEVLLGLGYDSTPCQYIIFAHVNISNHKIKYKLNQFLDSENNISTDIDAFIDFISSQSSGKIKIDNNYTYKK